MAARLRTGDEVVVITGKDKGKKGKIARVLENDKVVVEGLNLIKRHMRPTPKNQQGGILEREAPIQASNVMLVDPKTGKGTRVSFKVDGPPGKRHKVRIAKSGEEIPTPKLAERAGSDANTSAAQ